MDDDISNQVTRPPKISRSLPQVQDRALDDLCNRILRQTANSSRRGTLREDETLGDLPELTKLVERNSRLPTTDDYPLWRVKCRVSLNLAVFISCLITSESWVLRKKLSASY